MASEAQLWPVALLLARLLGDAAIAATAAAMAEQSVAEGAPLQTLLLLLGGAPADGALTAAAQAAAAGPAAAAAPAAAALWQQPGVFNPAAVAASATASSSGDAWRQHLAVIAANRTPGDEAAMLVLGSALFAAGRLLPAHTCCVLAGALLQPWDLAAAAAADAPAAGQAAPPMVGSKVAPAAPPLVLLGVDAMAQPRSLAQLPRILQTEVFTWSRTVGERGPGQGVQAPACNRVGGMRVVQVQSEPQLQATPHARFLAGRPRYTHCYSHPPATPPGNTSLSGQYLPVVPYKLLHAAALAELGAYLAAMNATLQVVVVGWGGGGAGGDAGWFDGSNPSCRISLPQCSVPHACWPQSRAPPDNLLLLPCRPWAARCPPACLCAAPSRWTWQTGCSSTPR